MLRLLFLATMIGCTPSIARALRPAIAPGPADVAVAIVGALSQSAADQRAEREADEAMRRKAQRENAEVRRTGERLAADLAAKPADTEQAVDRSLPDGLGGTAIGTGIAPVRSTAMACRDPSITGLVMVSVKVGSDGRVHAATVVSSPDPTLGGCVRAAVLEAVFEKTQRGTSFRYPFQF